jgi:hypothetical protein
MNDELRRFVDLIDAGQSNEAEAWATGRAKVGDADGQFLMGYLVFGSGEVDFRKACDWFHRAAAQDHPEALFQLSRIDQSEDRANWGPPRTDQMRAVLSAHMATYRRQTHKDLAGLVNKRMPSRIQSPAGAEYDVMVEVRWDDEPLGDVFVCGTVNDHGWKARQDVHEIFTKDPDGRIIGDSG